MKLGSGKFSYANVVATLALFITLSGGAYAAFHLPNNSVRSKHIRNGQVRSADVKNSTIAGKDVKNDSLTGDDIAEASLGEVPSAAKAGALEGFTAKSVTYSANSDTAGASKPFATLGSFTLSARCLKTGNDSGMAVWVSSSRSGIDLSAVDQEVTLGTGLAQNDKPFTAARDGLTANTLAAVAGPETDTGDQYDQVSVVARSPSSLALHQSAETLTVHLMLETKRLNLGSECVAYGTALLR